MNKMMILLKREYWENRGSIFILPMVLTGALILIMTLFAISASVNVDYSSVEIKNNQSQTLHLDSGDETLMAYIGPQLEEFATQPIETRERLFNEVFTGTGAIFYVTLWVFMQLYLLSCLFDERKDRSVLFWKSMPVSDIATVMSKLATALLVMPLFYLGFLVILQIAMLIGLSLIAAPYDVNIIDALWAPANLFSRWFEFAGYLLLSALWCLPLYGWLILVSSWAKSVPLAWVVGVPILLALLELVLADTEWVRSFVQTHIMLIEEDGDISLSPMIELLMSFQMLSALLVGMVFIALAIFVRGKSNEF